MISISKTADDSPSPEAGAGHAAEAPAGPVETDFSVGPQLTLPPEPLTRDAELRLLADLARMSAARAEAEKRLAEEFFANNQAADQEYADARREREARFATDSQKSQSDFATLKRRILSAYDAEFTPTQRDFAELQQRCETERSQNTIRAKRKLKERRWEADTIFDTNKHEPGKRLDEFRKLIEVISKRLRTIADQSRQLLVVWRQQRALDLPFDTPGPQGAESPAVLQQQVQQAENEHFELTQLSLPPWALPGRLLWVFLGPWALLAGPASWLIWPHGVWLSLIVALVVGTLLAMRLKRMAQDQVDATYPRLASTLAGAEALAARLLVQAEADCKRKEFEIADRRDREIKASDERFQKKIAETNERHESELSQAQNYYPQRLSEITARRDTALAAANAQHEQRLALLAQQHETDGATIQENFRAQVAAIKLAHASAWEAMSADWREGMTRLKSLVAAIDQREAALFPEWESLARITSPLADCSPPAIRFGHFDVDPAKLPGGIPADAALAALTPERITLPALLPFPNQTSLLIKTRGPGRALAVASLQTVMLRLLSALPPGKVRFTIIDPVGLGENFAAFMHLSDYDEALVANRIWTEPKHIEQRLADLSEHMENVIQKYLRNEFQSIEEYNAYAGEIAEPFRFLVIANFPAGFSEDAAKRLLSIVGSGARCGVNTLISVDMQAELPRDFQLRDLEQSSTVLVQKKDSVLWKHETLGEFPLRLESPPEPDDFTRILHTVGKYAKDAGRVEVPFEFIAPSVEQIWTSDSRKGIDVPLGRAGATRLQHLRLGHGTSQHVLVAGQTGSGKSTLLHALITNIALRYSPDEMELYLVDFKKGVEFKTYATHRLPHARVVAIESDREFGLSVLERLDAELKLRADRFRDLGVQDINGFRQAVPDEPLPRILLVIDEFQELFVEDDKISQNGALLLDRLVRQGRAFGVHLLLGSQTLGGAYSLARSTIGQIGVRIALRCSEVDAHLILSEENSAARLLSRAGEAIYNDANGMIEGNHPFQVVWLGDEPREAYLECVQEMARQRQDGRPWPQVVFEGNVPAETEQNVQLDALLRGAPSTTAHTAVQAWLGESVSIKDPTSAVFRPQSGSNLLVAGQNDEGSLGITAAAMISLLAQLRSNFSRSSGPCGYLLDGSAAGSPESAQLAELAAISPERIKLVGWRELNEAMSAISAEVTRRSQPGNEHHEPLFLFVYGLQRFRDLRKAEDDFGFSRAAEEKPNPAKQFANILREGPSLHVHTIVWCDSLNNLNRAFDRQTMREFEMRAVFQMGSGDSSTLIDTPLAGKLGPYRALYFSEEQGCLEKFRPYGFPSASYLNWVTERLKANP